MTLVVGLATDLDQRLLPDELTLPVIPLALVYAVSGQNPLVGAALIPALAAAIAHPGGACTCRRSRSGRARSGMGDVKFLVGMGLLLGGERALGGTLVGLIVAGVVLLALLLTRRIGAEVLHPVRAVPDHRRALGGADPGLEATGRRAVAAARVPDHAPGPSGSDRARLDRGATAARGHVGRAGYHPGSRNRVVRWQCPSRDGDTPAETVPAPRPAHGAD